MEPEGSLTCSVGPDSEPCPKSEKPSPHPHTPFFKSHFKKSFHISLGLPSNLNHSGFLIKILLALLICLINAMFPTHVIIPDLKENHKAHLVGHDHKIQKAN
jgi:hypothetical protein